MSERAAVATFHDVQHKNIRERKNLSRSASVGSAGYRDLYDTETRAIVGRLYAREAEAFGYAF